MRFTDDQIKAITKDSPRISVSAGAGSGKTAILVERIAHLLCNPRYWRNKGPALDRIVAITFTDKAADEMKARLRQRFREGQRKAELFEDVDWRELEREVDGARISTIHSFCASILRAHALRIGMDPEWGVLDDADANQLMEDTLSDTIEELLKKKDPATIRLSIEWGLQQLKSAFKEMFNKRNEWLDTENRSRYDNPDRLYAFWDDQWGRAKESFLQNCQFNRKLPFLLKNLQDLDGLCSSNDDRREMQRIACIRVLRAIADGATDLGDRIDHYKSEFPRMSISKKAWAEEDFKRVGEAIKEANSFLKEDCLLPTWNETLERAAARATCDFFQVGCRVMDAYRNARKAYNSLDFDDIINETLALLREDKELKEQVASEIEFLFIDEFQDTDLVQLEIAKLLSAVDKGPRLFVVGDAKQSIYYFRGAEVDLFNTFINEDPDPIRLKENFRSLPNVMNFVNTFFGASKMLAAVEVYRPTQAPRKALTGPRVEYFFPKTLEDEKLSEDKKHELEAQFIAARILEFCADNSSTEIFDTALNAYRRPIFDDIVLLFRRSTYMVAYETAFRAWNIPFNRVAGVGFFQRREIQDILALLQLIVDPWDEEALLTVLRSPMVGVSDETLMRMALAGGVASTFHTDRIPDNCDDVPALTRGRRLFKELYEKREEEPGSFIRSVLAKSNYEAILLNSHLGLQRAANLRKVIQLADNLGRSRSAMLHEFKRYLEEVTLMELKEGESSLQTKGMGAVTLITVHKAKGLEYPIVFLPETHAENRKSGRNFFQYRKEFGLSIKAPDEEGETKNGAFGALMSRFDDHENMMENARILYVAMTRARDYLVLCGRSDARLNSWAGMFNKVLNLHQWEHNDVAQGDGWSVLIKNDQPDQSKPIKDKAMELQLDPKRLDRQLQPLGITKTEKRVFSVSHLLAFLTHAESSLFECERDTLSEEGEDLSAQSPRNREFAMARGTLVHTLFERWDFKKDQVPDLRQLIMEAGLGLSQFDNLYQSLEHIIHSFRNSPLWSLYTRARRIEREVPFLFDIGPIMIRGVVDAVIDGNIIVDYKTGKAGGALESSYENQLYLYGAALNALQGQTPKEGLLWYAEANKVHTVAMDQRKIDEFLQYLHEFCGTFQEAAK
ncbi:MAG: UvrD-helicase domain-containing protein [Candidatus Hydrogenedentes bacterium]|nr:UvrD-helicase domain-containing protein [Candidatus Hydrogenedentota bacterium]